MLHRLRPLAARAHFRFRRAPAEFQLLCGQEVARLSRLAGAGLVYPAICNAGLVRWNDGYVAVAKNQRYSFPEELRPLSWMRSVRNKADDGLRALMRFDFDASWQLRDMRALRLRIDGVDVDPIVFTDDLRLMNAAEGIFAFANGPGSWPLLGRLDGDVLDLRNVRAPVERPQKNWMPFVDDGRILLEFSVDPHVILAAADDGACTPYVETDTPLGGTLHGGAPSLDLGDGRRLGLANSQHMYWFYDRYYAPVFYLFEAHSPYRVLRATPPLRLDSRMPRIQYACGMVFDYRRPRDLVISYCVADFDNVFTRVPLDDILNLMIELAPL